MTTAIIGTGGLGSVIARQLASGGETLRLSSADRESARTLAAQIGRAAVVAAGNRDALQGAGAVVLALRFTVLKGVIDEIAGLLAGKVMVVPSNPVSANAHGDVSRVLPEGQSSGKVVRGGAAARQPGLGASPGHQPATTCCASDALRAMKSSEGGSAEAPENITTHRSNEPHHAWTGPGTARGMPRAPAPPGWPRRSTPQPGQGRSERRGVGTTSRDGTKVTGDGLRRRTFLGAAAAAVGAAAGCSADGTAHSHSPDIQASGNTATTSSLSSDSASSSRSGPLSTPQSSTAAISLAVTRKLIERAERPSTLCGEQLRDRQARTGRRLTRVTVRAGCAHWYHSPKRCLPLMLGALGASHPTRIRPPRSRWTRPPSSSRNSSAGASVNSSPPWGGPHGRR